jgi:hypothetical protein
LGGMERGADYSPSRSRKALPEVDGQQPGRIISDLLPEIIY